MEQTNQIKYGRLTLLQEVKIHDGSRYRTHYKCKCDCGNEVTTRKDRIIMGVVSSCGCLQRERAAEANRTHGAYLTPEYNVYLGMISRCYNVNNSAYPNYGGRGITVCPRWLESFENFFEDMGPRPTPKHTIERENNEGNYEPSNCTWETRAKQNRNFRRNRLVTYQGRTQCVAAWVEELHIDRNKFNYYTREKGYSDPEAIDLLVKRNCK